MSSICLPLEGIKLVVPKIFADDRGFFFESYNKNVYEQLGITTSFVQDNTSFSKYGTIRALHFSPGQAKLIRCVQGEIWDVAVDIRKTSETFGKWWAEKLDDKSHHQLFIPDGFAHGYCVLSDTALVHYKVSTFYNPKTEYSIRWNDPTIGIEWPIINPTLSPRDQTSPFFKEIFQC